MKTGKNIKIRSDFYIQDENKILFEKFLLLSNEYNNLNKWCIDVKNHKTGYCELFDEIYSETRGSINALQDFYACSHQITLRILDKMLSHL